MILAEEKPLLYHGKNRYLEGFQRRINLEGGVRFRIGAYLVAAEVHTPKHSYDHLLEVAWELHYHRPKPWHSPEELWRLGLHYAKHSLYVQEGVYRGFSKGLIWTGESGGCGPGQYLVGWTGRTFFGQLHDSH